MRLNPVQNRDNTGYTGHLRDNASGLNYMQARYYDPLIGRFLSTDPIGYQDQLNLYAYVANDPVNNIDPTGESAISILFKIVIKGGDVGSALKGVTDDLATIANPTASSLDKGIALVSLASEAFSPVSLKDAKAAGNAVQGALKGKTCCFVAGTLVETADGLKPIETIKAGDLVLSRDAATGETALKPVTAVIPEHERVIWTVELTGVDGAEARFETTDEHPWWIAGQGWKRTDELRPGMAVTTEDGRGMTVAAVADTGRKGGVFNLTVADFETYFVGDEGVLVHNCGKVDPKSLTSTQGRREINNSQVNRLTKSMKEGGFDQGNPITVTQDGAQILIVDGNHRAAAAIKAGIGEVPIQKVDVSSEQLQSLREGAAEAAFDRERK